MLHREMTILMIIEDKLVLIWV